MLGTSQYHNPTSKCALFKQFAWFATFSPPLLHYLLYFILHTETDIATNSESWDYVTQKFRANFPSDLPGFHKISMSADIFACPKFVARSTILLIRHDLFYLVFSVTCQKGNSKIDGRHWAIVKKMQITAFLVLSLMYIHIAHHQRNSCQRGKQPLTGAKDYLCTLNNEIEIGSLPMLSQMKF